MTTPTFILAPDQPTTNQTTNHTHVPSAHPSLPPSLPRETNQHTQAGPSGLVDHGVHAFVVPLRDDAGRCLPGVEIHDCGYKVSVSVCVCVCVLCCYYEVLVPERLMEWRWVVQP